MDHERYADKLITDAISRGDMVPMEGTGEPLPILERDPDWWIRSFLEREELPDRHRVFAAERKGRIASAVACPSLDEARSRLAAVNRVTELWNASVPRVHRFAELTEVWLITERAAEQGADGRLPDS